MVVDVDCFVHMRVARTMPRQQIMSAPHYGHVAPVDVMSALPEASIMYARLEHRDASIRIVRAHSIGQTIVRINSE